MVTGLTCFRVGALLARRTVGLTESERLSVESHRSECQRCQKEARVLEGIRATVSDEPVLSTQARELLLRRALEVASVARVASAPAHSSLRSKSWAIAAVVAALSTLLALHFRVAPLHSVAQGDRVASGVVSLSGKRVEVGAQVLPGAELESEEGARLALGHAQVELTPRSKVVWKAAESTLVLVGGGVRVEVEHVEHQRFRVAAASFLVEVVGTAFSVDAQGVQVTRGTVRVLSSDGHDVLAVLPPGGAWSAPGAGKVASAESAESAESASVASEADLSQVAPVGGSRDSDSAGSVLQWLNEARHALSAHHTAEARRAVEAAMRLHPTSNELAEARTLLAECAGASGDSARAVRLYLAVAKRFPALPAAENALFAAARTQDRAGAGHAAQQLFAEYLQRYPTGRFHEEAERHLLRLRASATDQ